MKLGERYLELAECPKCGAKCEKGHDEDGMVYCAKCGHTFVPNDFTALNETDGKALVENARSRSKIHRKGGWTAYEV